MTIRRALHLVLAAGAAAPEDRAADVAQEGNGCLQDHWRERLQAREQGADEQRQKALELRRAG